MQRSFSALDLVTVPRSSAGLAIALGTALLTRAQAEPALPPVFVRPLKRLAEQHGALCGAHEAQLDEPADDAAATGEADQQLDTAWSGLQGFLISNTKLSASPAGVERGERARVVLAMIFPDGLRFVNLPYREQWAESKRRLAKLGEPPTAEHVKALGGEPFVAAIEAAQERYGEVLHLTKPKKAPNQAKVRDALERMLAAVRSYVLRVANYLDENEDDAGAQAVGYALLAPLATWKSSGSGRKAPPADDSNDGGAGEGEPGDEDDEAPGDAPDGAGDEPDGTSGG
jgi:hypothetical protein